MATTTILNAGDHKTMFLPMREQITVIAASGGGSASVTHLGDKAGEPALSVADVAIGQSRTFTAVSGPARYDIQCLTGSVSVVQAPISFGASGGGGSIPVSGTVGDMIEIVGAGAPVDGVTGADLAGIGSRYTDTTAGKLYINGGTLAVPAWKIVTSA